LMRWSLLLRKNSDFKRLGMLEKWNFGILVRTP
jgi:hypothetical protein